MSDAPFGHRGSRLLGALGQWLQAHPALVLGIFAFSRLAILPWRITRLVGSDRYYDFRHFFELARLADQGQYPYIHYWMEYPPVYPWLLVLARKLSTWLAAGAAAEAIFYTLLGGLLVACEIGIFILVWRLAARLYGPSLAWRSALLYGVLFVPVYLWTGWFDSLPALLFLLAIYLLITQRAGASAVAAAIGAAAKIFPALLVPLALCALPGVRRRARYLAVVVVIIAAAIIPLWLAGPTFMQSSLQAMLGRSSWETIWAVAEGYYGAGSVARLPARQDPASAAVLMHPASLPLGLLPVVFVVICLLTYWHFRRLSAPLTIIAVSGFTLHLLLLLSKGYSPQYLIWLAPLIAVVFPSWRGVVYLGLLSAVNLLEYPVYFHFFPQVRPLLVVIVVARTLLLAIVAVNYLTIALRDKRPHPQM